ncbi:MAG: RnfABCDGE type electron transport complex subunit D [Treponema sp.]|nr:RnfABCDGE type electron transport complex subunit D [Candidatus Treponema equifaecale]
MNKNEKLYKTLFLSPFRYLKPSVRTEAYFILVLLIPQLIMLGLTKSFDSLILILASCIASCLVEGVDLFFQKKDKFSWVIALLNGIMIGLLLPASFPVFPVFVISLCVLLINRYILGGFANSWINSIAITVAICWIIGMKFFPPVSLSLAELQTRNPALALIQNGTFSINSLDAEITAFLNQKVFSIFKVSIPDGYVSLFWDSQSAIPAFRFNFITLISSIILIGFDIMNPIIPVTYIAVYSVLVRFIAPFFYNGPLMQGDIILAMLTSGTLFCTFYLLQWPGTTPFTNRGKFTYGIMAGIAAFFIVGCGTSPSGAVFTILIINVVSLLIQSFENKLYSDFSETVLSERVKNVKEGTDA